MRHKVCQHCPELLEYVRGAWRTVPTLPARSGATHCRGMLELPHKPMPEVNVRA